MNWLDPFAPQIERAVSSHLNHRWQITHIEDKSDRASHPSLVLSDGRDAVFVKLGQGQFAADQIQQEANGLRLLSEVGKVRTPRVIATLKFAERDQALLIMEAIPETIERQPEHWRQMGRALAQLHHTKGPRFGFDIHCYWGSLYQDNTPHDDWPEFFWQRRIAPRLQAALTSGNLPHELAQQVDGLRGHLNELCGPPIAPALLHGDAQQNNFLCTPNGIFFIDPSAYYGHPEIDLAHIDFFAPTPIDFFSGYQEITPIDPGFTHRRDLWRIPAWLAMIEVDGPQHVDILTAVLQKYI